MKILYLSCHSILEYDELIMLTELGHEVKSHGAYRDPRGAYTLPRPGIPLMQYDEDWMQLTAINPKTDLKPEMYEWADVIIIMSGENEATLRANWDRIKHKRVILRMIGQSTPSNELMLKKYRNEGLEIVRYSPKEANMQNYAGEDAMIRFAKDPDEFSGWNGKDAVPINFSQSLKGRGRSVHYDEIMGSMVGFTGAKVYGTGNNDLGTFNGGEMPYEELKRLLRDSGCFIYGGTWPAPYTLTFMEAMMTGIPIVAISRVIAHLPEREQFDFYEVEEILATAGVTSCSSVEQMREKIIYYLQNKDEFDSKKMRDKAIELFGKENIKKQWEQFLER